MYMNVEGRVPRVVVVTSVSSLPCSDSPVNSSIHHTAYRCLGHVSKSKSSTLRQRFRWPSRSEWPNSALVSGFSVGHMEKLRRVVNARGATRFNQLSEAVSHVVLGKKVDEHLTTIQGWNLRPQIIYVDWIAEQERSVWGFKWPSSSSKGHRKNKNNSSLDFNNETQELLFG
ncbi:hypothetical protein Pcinc_022286 [Petrolisthes cinctipes]|uniref:BRCT domain-containing protein n=1 Tax=Petrolisthes cinctipes TaxID=88211 RepID=A0AAE1FFS9_PETCI|nr:hypothetical protein Pcinc_022286 [Petrolisthes cinctipes]